MPVQSPPEATPRTQLEKNVFRFYLFRFLANLNLWLPIWVVYLQKERGLSIAQVAALDAPFWLVVLTAEVPTGAFADRFGRRCSLLVSSGVLAVAYAVFGVASSYPIILASYVLWAIGMAFQSGADLAFLYDNLVALGRADQYPKAAGRASAVMALAAILALLTGAQLADMTRLDTPILVSAGICGLSGLIALTLREPPHQRTGRPGMLGTVRLGAAEAWRDPRLRYMLGFSAVVQAATLVPVLLVQPFLERHGVSVARYGLLQTPARLCAMVAAIMAYRLAHWLSERRVILALPVWLCGCFALVAAWDSPLAFIAFPLLALGFSAANPLLSDYLNRHTDAAQRATVLSIGQLVSSLLLFVLEPAAGAIAQGAGLPAAFLATAGFTAVAGLVTLGPWLRYSSGARVAVGPGSA